MKIDSIRKQFIYKCILILVIIGYFSFWWFYSLGILPGLHGDEAWSGIKANYYRYIGIDQLTGMTTYTGILQSLLIEASFSLFDIGVFQLRFPGAFINLISLLIVIVSFIKFKAHKQMVYFTLLVAASPLLLTSARIAWEVNSFTLLFISISFIALIKIESNKSQDNSLWVSLFFFINILGTYNHIIYSCVPASALCGLFLWSNYNRSLKYKNMLALLVVNFFGVCITFLVIKYSFKDLHEDFVYIPILLLFFVLSLYGIYLKLKDIDYKMNVFIPPAFIKYLLLLSTIVFIYFHGHSFFDMLSGYKILLQLYSYQSSQFCILLYVLCAGAIISYLTFTIISRFLYASNSILEFFILSYLGLFSLYTIDGSFRYYLSISVILSLYLSFILAKEDLKRQPFIMSQLIYFILLNIQLLDIFIYNPPKKAIDFTIGSKQKETSAHFLPKGPLIKFLKNHNTGSINYLVDPYFIEQPIQFYKLFTHWKELPQNNASINYDYINQETGFIILNKK